MQQTCSQSMKVCVTYSRHSLKSARPGKAILLDNRIVHVWMHWLLYWQILPKVDFSPWGECVLSISFLAMDTNPHTLGKACCAWCTWEINWLRKRYRMVNLRDQPINCHCAFWLLPKRYTCAKLCESVLNVGNVAESSCIAQVPINLT